MKRTLSLLLLMMLGMSAALTVCAEEKITVNANSTEISDGLDLRAVANLFAKSKNLEAFEQTLNDPKESYTNLDLNGDGEVDYIRVIETTENKKHIIVLQAVLAKDIYQDVATIIVEGDSDNASIRIQGDERIYGANYVIEPVFYYRPVIYDWFWGPSWYCWSSPYYWGGWPGWWAPYAPCPRVVYVNRCCCCCAQSACSFRTSSSARTVRTSGSGRITSSGRAATSGRVASAASRTPSSGRVATGRAQDLKNFTTTSSSRSTTPAAVTRTSRASSASTVRPTASTSRPTSASTTRPTSATATRATSSTRNSVSTSSMRNGTFSAGRSTSFSGSGMSGGFSGGSAGGGASHSAGAHSGAGRR